jgi:hypothetical protein
MGVDEGNSLAHIDRQVTRNEPTRVVTDDADLDGPGRCGGWLDELIASTMTARIIIAATTAPSATAGVVVIPSILGGHLKTGLIDGASDQQPTTRAGDQHLRDAPPRAAGRHHLGRGEIFVVHGVSLLVHVSIEGCTKPGAATRPIAAVPVEVALIVVSSVERASRGPADLLTTTMPF